MTLSYTLIRSSRRTLSIQIDREGGLIVRAPRVYPVYLIEHFIEAKKSWIQKHVQKIKDRIEKTGERKEYTDNEIKAMKTQLTEYLTHRVPKLWNDTNLPKYTGIKVTKSDKRWGSCSGKNGLCFSYRLAESLVGNPRFVDAVIVHELAHLREKHHQSSFWRLVYTMIPDYETIMNNHKSLD